jgi:hypothetical protein
MLLGLCSRHVYCSRHMYCRYPFLEMVRHAVAKRGMRAAAGERVKAACSSSRACDTPGRAAPQPLCPSRAAGPPAQPSQSYCPKPNY